MLTRITIYVLGISAKLSIWYFSHLGVMSGSLFLIAPFPGHCLLVLFFSKTPKYS